MKHIKSYSIPCIVITLSIGSILLLNGWLSNNLNNVVVVKRDDNVKLSSSSSVGAHHSGLRSGAIGGVDNKLNKIVMNDTNIYSSSFGITISVNDSEVNATTLAIKGTSNETTSGTMKKMTKFADLLSETNYSVAFDAGYGDPMPIIGRIEHINSPSSSRNITKAAQSNQTSSPMLQGKIILQTLGEMGNNLAHLAYYFAVKTIALEEFNLDLTLHVRKQKARKADSAAEHVKCLVSKSLRGVDFDECSWLKTATINGITTPKGEICQAKINAQLEGLSDLQRNSSNQTILEQPILEMKSTNSEGIKSTLGTYVAMLQDKTILEYYKEKGIGWTDDAPYPFLFNADRIHASDQLVNEFYSRGLLKFFAFDNETKYSSQCCKELPKRGEHAYHYRSFITDLPYNQFHLTWGGGELTPPNAAKMLSSSLPPGSNIALVPGRSDGKRIQAYKDAFTNSSFNVRIVKGESGIQDFCFLNHAEYVWGTIQSSYAAWASILNKNLHNATLYAANYPLRKTKRSSKVASNPELAARVHYPVYDLSNEDVW